MNENRISGLGVRELDRALTSRLDGVEASAASRPGRVLLKLVAALVLATLFCSATAQVRRKLGTVERVTGKVHGKVRNAAPRALHKGDTIVVGESVKLDRGAKLAVRHRDGTLETLIGKTGWIELRYRIRQDEKALRAQLRIRAVASVQAEGVTLLYPPRNAKTIPVLGFHLRASGSERFTESVRISAGDDVLYEKPNASFVHGMFADPKLNAILEKYAGKMVTIELGELGSPSNCTLLDASQESELKEMLDTFAVLHGQDRLVAEGVAIYQYCGTAAALEQARMSQPWENLVADATKAGGE